MQLKLQSALLQAGKSMRLDCTYSIHLQLALEPQLSELDTCTRAAGQREGCNPAAELRCELHCMRQESSSSSLLLEAQLQMLELTSSCSCASSRRLLLLLLLLSCRMQCMSMADMNATRAAGAAESPDEMRHEPAACACSSGTVCKAVSCLPHQAV